ncbi:RNA polymerase subunit sigma-24 [Arachidicoccus ginsenosidimutans]|uniref:sigma-70 family RNA polymerase sigma factor n=1 Tax=Arachidicoccus sp. BS20 TaxID=1850526 RepID=UPI0007F0EB39|nr:sigma-70 family RNA polymerase sigma factor [Arachidicoccus sp. BS20]ANI89696.1 RNA polymerase subunit sigma-24 [Arachidicoccus sp. BS20]
MASPEEVKAKDWVKEYADYLYRYAVSHISDEETARELVQETFLAALESLPAFKQKSSVRTWLTSILRNKLTDEYRRKSRIKPLQTGNESEDFFEENGFWKEAYQPKAFGLEADAALHNKELDNILKRCFKKMPSLWSVVFALKYLDDEKTSAICKRLQITASNYWVILHRAKLNLRDCLQKTWFNL